MGTLGTEVLAAHQIVFQTMLIIFMIPLGMSYAATVRVGQWFGQKNLKGIRQAGYLSIGGRSDFCDRHSYYYAFVSKKDRWSIYRY